MKDSIKNLIIDEYFGIYTRNGLEYILKNNTNIRHIYLLDFDNVKKMNENFGYRKVNEIFNKTFSVLKDKFIIGRAFSGDEIFLCTTSEDNSWIIPFLTEKCLLNDLSFKYVHSVYNSEIDVFKEKLNELIDKLHK